MQCFGYTAQHSTLTARRVASVSGYVGAGSRAADTNDTMMTECSASAAGLLLDSIICFKFHFPSHHSSDGGLGLG